MYLQIEDFLTAAEAQGLAEIARRVKFIDGRGSNPHNTTKVNFVADQSDSAAQQASQMVLAAFQRSEAVRNFSFPRRVAVPTLCRYEAGMQYGAHVDAAFLPVGPQPLRSDISGTVFIADPGGYQGGELIVYQGSEEFRFKGKPGSAVFYPSTTVHQVAPVTVGERLVAITFIESEIPDQLQRDLLYTLNEVRALEGLKMEWQSRIRLHYVGENLRRMWSR